MWTRLIVFPATVMLVSLEEDAMWTSTTVSFHPVHMVSRFGKSFSAITMLKTALFKFSSTGVEFSIQCSLL